MVGERFERSKALASRFFAFADQPGAEQSALADDRYPGQVCVLVQLPVAVFEYTNVKTLIVRYYILSTNSVLSARDIFISSL